MKRHLRRSIWVAPTVAVFTLLCATPALATPAYVTETVVTPSLTSQQQGPSVTFWSESWETAIAVFEDDRKGDWDVYARDLSGPLEMQVTTGPADQRRPSAAGSWVAYEDDRNGDWDIYLYNLTRQEETRLTSNAAAQLDPAVSGDWRITGTKVAWEDRRSGDWDIYLYDAATATTKRLTTSTAAQVDPAVDGSRVVWADRRNGDWDIYLYDTVKKTTMRLTTNGADQKAPAIRGTMVVYQDDRNGDWDIYGYDLATKKERRLTRNTADQTLPSISARRLGSPDTPGWRVVYQDARNAATAGTDVYLSDIPAGGECRLTDSSGDQLAPAIYGSDVVYGDLRDASSGAAQSDVYDARLAILRMTGAVDPLIVDYNGAVSLTGTLEDLGAVPVTGARLFRYVRIDADDHPSTASTLTDGSGAYLWTLAGVQRNAKYRVVYKGDATHLPAASDILTVQARAWLSQPSIPREFSFTKTVNVSCYLKPRHAAGSYPVKFDFYRYYRASGDIYPDWHLAKTVKGKAADYSTSTKCSAKVTLPKPRYPNPLEETWRVYAVHKDATHARSESPYRKFVVNSLSTHVPIVP